MSKKIHTALAEILKAMSVEKGGKLPQNMGGKPYITAADLNAEAKRQFVEHGIILIPNERVVKHESVIANNRIAVLISVEGTYELIAVEDGSSVTISGAGDGLAQGSAVASNIASTNALKNALLRTFLVTEQSAEDAGKSGVSDGAESPVRQTPAAKRIEQARVSSGDNQYVAALKRWVSSGGAPNGETVDGPQIKAVAARLHGEGDGWKKDEGKSQQVHDAIAAGERK